MNESSSPHAYGSVRGSIDGRERVEGVPRLLVLAKAWSVLDAFSDGRPELSMADLVSRTGLPPSTCVRLVRNLAHDGVLERNGERYRIGLAIVRWAGRALRGRSLVEVAGPMLEWLRDRTGESALLCVRDGRFVVVVASASSTQEILRQVRLGEVLPLHAGSIGKTFLAFDPDAWEALRGVKLRLFTERTVTSRSALHEHVEEVRRRGYAISSEERNNGAAGVTAPVLDAQGRQVGSIGITGPVSRLTAETLERFAPLVMGASRRITRQLAQLSFSQLEEE